MAYPARFEIYPGADGWRWRFRAANNGETVASGEAYVNRADCLRVLELLKAQVATAEVVEVAPPVRMTGLFGIPPRKGPSI